MASTLAMQPLADDCERQRTKASPRNFKQKSGVQDPDTVPINEIDYRDQGGPLLRYLWCKQPLAGQTLYLGGEVGSDNCVYYIPGHATRVLRLDPQNNDELDLVGPDFPGKFKWLRGVRVGHVIYGLPCHADCVLRIDTTDSTNIVITTIPIPYDEFYSIDASDTHREQIWKYHGGNISPIDGCIYAIPQSAKHVLKVDPATDTCSLVGPYLEGCYKWYGGVVSHIDNALYGIPHDSPSVLRICPDSSRDDYGITLHGQLFDDSVTGHQWHGAAMASNGTVVCVPANANQVLCITPQADTAEPKLTLIGDETIIQTGRHRSDQKYKYLGASATTKQSGKQFVYVFPSGSEHVLRVDANNMTICNLQPNLYEKERLCQNKWQNGVVVNDTAKRDANNHTYVYGIPLAAESLLRIDVSSSGNSDDMDVTTWHLPKPFKSLAKFEGGVVVVPTAGESKGKQIVYTVPNNSKAVLRIEGCDSSTAVEEDAKNHDSITLDTQDSKHEAGSLNVLDDKHNNQKQLPKHNDSPSLDRRLTNLERQAYKYQSGIPTLRSSAHRVKFNLKCRNHDPEPVNRQGIPTGTTWLPSSLCQPLVFSYDAQKYNLADRIRAMLQECDGDMVGRFRDGSTRLEDFEVASKSTWRSVNGGQCEDAQKYLSSRVEGDCDLLNAFDDFVTEFVLPQLKQRLVEESGNNPDEKITFYYQRPPTLRLQPGPAWAQVKAHNDAEYGHQNGELNYWVVFTDRTTGVDLYCESEHMRGDYKALVAEPGQIVSFHGSSCRHFVSSNASCYTRVSMDFRVGVQGYFDPYWQMKGTTNDHGRTEVTI